MMPTPVEFIAAGSLKTREVAVSVSTGVIELKNTTIAEWRGDHDSKSVYDSNIDPVTRIAPTTARRSAPTTAAMPLLAAIREA